MEHHIKFDHGLGDAANFAHALKLWIDRGHKITIDTTPDKAPLFLAAGADVRPGTPTEHHYWHPPAPGEPEMNDPWAGNKVAWSLVDSPLPPIGNYRELWHELTEVKLRLNRPDTAPEIDQFLATIDGPLVLVHTRGNTTQHHKNASAELEQDIYRELLWQTDATLLLLDWDNRVSRIPGRRVRHLTDDFRRLTLPELAYLMERSALVIGVDSGPLHLSRFTNCPALGVWFGHHPAHYALPRQNTAHLTADHHGAWNRTRRHNYNVLDCPKITGTEVAKHAARMLKGMDGRELVVANCLDRVRTVTGQGLHDRDETFKIVADHLSLKSYPRMVETGCSRVKYGAGGFDDWTAGHSTYVFGLLLDDHGGHLDSVDIDGENVAIAREWVSFTTAVDVHHSDSREWLKTYQGEPFDVAYLDSADLGTDHFEEINLEECRLVLPHLKADALILIDDTYHQGGAWHGKGKLTIPWLQSQGWYIVKSGWQTLLRRL
jgi:hypothetical protein